MSQHSGSISPLSEHPASPALLTNDGPHGRLCSKRARAAAPPARPPPPHRTAPAPPPPPRGGGAGDRPVGGPRGVSAGPLSRGAARAEEEHAQKPVGTGPRGAGRTQAPSEEACLARLYTTSMPIHSSRIGPGGRPPGVCLSCVALPDITTCRGVGICSTEPSYPEGNFRGNQLLGGSIGLSPLCRTQATQFARQNSDRPPPQFPMASSWNGIVHHLSGPMDLASTQNPVHWTAGPAARAASGDPERRGCWPRSCPCGPRCLHHPGRGCLHHALWFC